MANDSRKNASHGELISLREYVDMRFESQEKAVSAALAAADRAVSKAESSTERRLEGMNEFRSALGDYSRTLTPRPEFEAMVRDMKEKIDALTTRLNARDLMPRVESEGRHNDAKQRIDELISRMNAGDEQKRGRGDLWGWIVGAIGALLAVVAYLKGGQ